MYPSVLPSGYKLMQVRRLGPNIAATKNARYADMSAPPRTPQSPPARLGKDKESWDVLLV